MTQPQQEQQRSFSFIFTESQIARITGMVAKFPYGDVSDLIDAFRVQIARQMMEPERALEKAAKQKTAKSASTDNATAIG